MKFSEVHADESIKERLKELVWQNRLSHALLFLGREGSGSLPLAIAFAQYILCERINKPSNEPDSLFGQMMQDEKLSMPEDSCGNCPACIKAAKMMHPDLHFSYPSLKRDSRHERVLSTDFMQEWRQFILQQPYGNVTDWIDFLKGSASAKIDSPANKQANITSAECDEIGRKLSLKPFESNYKILIMWMPEFLGKEGNKLLKLIEEPPPDTIFLLVAEEESAILPTILSRTQLIKIPSLTNSEVQNVLANEHNIAFEKASQIAAIADGNLREALQLLNAGDQEDDFQVKIRNWLNVILKNNASAQVKWVDDMSKTGREKQKQFLKYFIHLLQQAIRVRFIGEAGQELVPANEIDFVLRINSMCTVSAMEQMIRQMDDSIYHIERNANAKMLFHGLSIRFYYIIKDNLLILVQ